MIISRMWDSFLKILKIFLFLDQYFLLINSYNKIEKKIFTRENVV